MSAGEPDEKVTLTSKWRIGPVWYPKSFTCQRNRREMKSASDDFPHSHISDLKLLRCIYEAVGLVDGFKSAVLSLQSIYPGNFWGRVGSGTER